MTRHVFSADVNSRRSCVCHGLSREEVVADLPQHEQLPLVSLTEIAMRAGVNKPVVSRWRTKPIFFPEPVAVLGRVAVWWWPDVEAWLEATGRETDAGWTAEQVVAGPSQVRNRAEWRAAIDLGRDEARKKVAGDELG